MILAGGTCYAIELRVPSLAEAYKKVLKSVIFLPSNIRVPDHLYMIRNFFLELKNSSDEYTNKFQVT